MKDKGKLIELLERGDRLWTLGGDIVPYMYKGNHLEYRKKIKENGSINEYYLSWDLTSPQVVVRHYDRHFHITSPTQGDLIAVLGFLHN
jgi:hypothetical protein